MTNKPKVTKPFFINDLSNAENEKVAKDKLYPIGSYFTKNYEMFLKPNGYNRDTLPKNIAKIEDSMEHNGVLTSLTCIKTHAFAKTQDKNSSNYYGLFLVDGQNRLKAIENLKKPFQCNVYTFSNKKEDNIKNILKVVSKLNSTGQKWSKLNYVLTWEMYEQTNKLPSHYKRLRLALETSKAQTESDKKQRPLQISDILTICFGQSSGEVYKKFTGGEMEISEDNWKKVEEIKQVLPILPQTSYARRPFYALLNEEGAKNRKNVFNAITEAYNRGERFDELNELALRDKIKSLYKKYTSRLSSKKSSKKQKDFVLAA